MQGHCLHIKHVGPSGSTTVYGSASNLPATLQTSLLSASGGSLIFIGIAAVVLFAMMGKK